MGVDGNDLRVLDSSFKKRVYTARKKAARPKVGFPKDIATAFWAVLQNVFWVSSGRILELSVSVNFIP